MSPSSDDESNKNSTATPLLQRSASTGSIASVGQSNTSSTLKQSVRKLGGGDKTSSVLFIVEDTVN